MFLSQYLTVIRGAPRLMAGVPRCSFVHPKIPPVLWGVPKDITITPMVLQLQSSEIPITLEASRNALLVSDTLLKLTHPHSHSTTSWTFLEASSDSNTLCWCYVSSCVLSQYDDEGVLNRVEYFSKHYTPAECKYDIYVEKLMLSIKALEE